MTKASDCIFCNFDALDIIAENEMAIAVTDKFPVKPLHTLIIPKRHSDNIFETTPDEREAMHHLAMTCIETLKSADNRIEGVNFGSNIGAVAGQKIFHTHLHLIPRRRGDLDPPPARHDD